MFHLPNPFNPRPPPLNAISQPPQTEEEEARVRHLSVCRELIELGMGLTRSAAKRAHEAADPDPEPPLRDATQDAPPHPPKSPDPNLAFTRHAHAVREAVKLEQATLAGAAFRTPTPRHQGPNVEHLTEVINHGVITEGLHRLTENHPDQWNLHDTIEETAAETLAAHPEDPLPAHFARACQALGLTPTLTGFPDHLIEALSPDRPGWDRRPPPDG